MSWYTRHSRPQSPLPSDPEKGGGLDFGKWYRCQICAQLCKLGRDALGGSDSPHGAVYEEWIQPSLGGDPGTSVACMLGDFVALKSTMDGTAETILYNQTKKFDKSSGCPLCSSKNWRGDY